MEKAKISDISIEKIRNGGLKDLIPEIIRYHGNLHAMVEPDNENLNKEFDKFKRERKNIILDLILLTLADTLGSQLNKNFPERFKFKTDFYNKILMSE
jgi:predicted house-cleaning noncanonical NTP pyrophosphatase (MazG superfamily)